MKKAVMIFAVLVLAVLSVLAYAGFFRTVTIGEGMSEKYTLVLKKTTGDYSQAGVVLDEVFKYLKGIGVDAETGAAIYLDNPRKVKKADLRWVGGCVLPDSAKSRIGEIRKKYLVKEFKPVKSAMTTFPCKIRLNLVAGIMRVYPALNAYSLKNKLETTAIMEVYDMKGKQTIFVMPVVKGWDAVKLFYGSNK